VRHLLRPYHQCSLYLRTFGSTNHEVKTTADGQLETIRPIEGRFYRFNLVLTDGNTGPGQLVITELDPTQPDCGLLELQLLDTGAGDSCAGWGDQLPVRLREMHSHWYCRWGGGCSLQRSGGPTGDARVLWPTHHAVSYHRSVMAKALTANMPHVSMPRFCSSDMQRQH
jgi:hypothetical protein